ncbi:uncharacterized protein LOC120702912 [Panicum virgatum]|uniref:Uncharacterized protein n=1 Tax=Panicum virgatum TaxID=38727 RepID=A0A8T0TIS4_PANVG|nr:uncharacterized protein LOC120702912 [Panicum virgatum]KAG2610127.1 hypothetical protein PVAP13_4KG097700 [Panicum virgatum]
MADGGGCSGRPAPGTNMPRDGLARGLEVEAALTAEAAWELKEAVASMAAGSLDMDVDSPPHLPVETSANKDNLDGEEQSLQASAAMSLEESNRRINRLIAMHKKLSEANMASLPSQVEKRKRSTSAVNASNIVHISETDQTSFPTPISSVHKRSKRVGSKKSLVWKHFDTGLRGQDPIATCKYCGFQ